MADDDIFSHLPDASPQGGDDIFAHLPDAPQQPANQTVGKTSATGPMAAPTSFRSEPSLAASPESNYTARVLGGWLKPVLGGQQLLAQGASYLAPETFGGWKESANKQAEYLQKNQEELARRAGNKPGSTDWVDIAGQVTSPFNFLAGAAPVSAVSKIPAIGAALEGTGIGANLAKGALQTAGMETVAPVTGEGLKDYWGTKGSDVGMGALTSLPATAGLHGIGSIVKPAIDEAAQKFIELGGKPTVGQTLGWPFKKVEEGFKSVPIASDIVNAAEQRANLSFNKVAANDILSGIYPSSGVKQTVDKSAKDAQAIRADIKTKLGNEYDRVQSQADLRETNDFASDIINALDRGDKELGTEQNASLNRIVNSQIIEPLQRARLYNPNGALSGKEIQDMTSMIKGHIKDNLAGNANEKVLGRVLIDVKAAVDKAIERQNPGDVATDWKAINAAWAKYSRYRDAMGSVGAQTRGGEFTPAQLGRASVRGATPEQKAQLTAPLEDIATMGRRVLGQTLADSGTPYRLATLGMLGLGGGAAYEFPETAANAAIPIGLLAGMYTPAGQYLLRNAITARPPGSQAVRDILQKYAPTAASRAALIRSENQ